MSSYIPILNDWSDHWFSQLGTFAWQSSLLVLVVAVASRLFKRASPAMRFWLWQVVAVKLLLLPFWTIDATLPDWLATKQSQSGVTTRSEAPVSVSTSGPSPDLAQQSTELSSSEVSQPAAFSSVTPESRISWQTWLLSVWLAVASCKACHIFMQRRGLSRLLQQAQPAVELEALVHECATKLGLRQPPTTVLVDAELSPFVCGLRRPMLVLPQSLVGSAQPNRLRQVVLHELAHIRRRDLLWCWIPTVVQITYWFHPVVHWLVRRIQLERELACDQLAIQQSGSTARDYADTLIEVVSHSASQVAAQAAFSTNFLGGAKR